jgi:hypothetical protein
VATHDLREYFFLHYIIIIRTKYVSSIQDSCNIVLLLLRNMLFWKHVVKQLVTPEYETVYVGNVKVT